MSKSFRKAIACLCTQKTDSWSAGKVREYAKKRRQKTNMQLDEDGIPILPVHANAKWPVGGGRYWSAFRNPKKLTIYEYRKGRLISRIKGGEWTSRLSMCF